MQIWGISWQGSFAALSGTVIFAAAAIASICYLVHIIFQIFGPKDAEETVPEKIRRFVKEKMSRALAWLDKWWPLFVLSVILAVAAVEWRFILDNWYFFLPADIVLNLVLAHFLKVSFSDLKKDWTDGDLGWFFGQIFLFWLITLAFLIPLPPDEEKEGAWD